MDDVPITFSGSVALENNHEDVSDGSKAMSRGTLSILLLLMMAGAPAVQAQLTDSEALQFMAGFEAALATEDFKKVAPLIHPQAVFRFSEGDHSGMADIQAAMERTWAHEVDGERYTLTDKRVLRSGEDAATVLFTWNWSGDSAEHGPFEIVGRGTVQLVRHEGTIKILVEHLSR